METSAGSVMILNPRERYVVTCSQAWSLYCRVALLLFFAPAEVFAALPGAASWVVGESRARRGLGALAGSKSAGVLRSAYGAAPQAQVSL